MLKQSLQIKPPEPRGRQPNTDIEANLVMLGQKDWDVSINGASHERRGAILSLVRTSMILKEVYGWSYLELSEALGRPYHE